MFTKQTSFQSKLVLSILSAKQAHTLLYQLAPISIRAEKEIKAAISSILEGTSNPLKAQSHSGCHLRISSNRDRSKSLSFFPLLDSSAYAEHVENAAVPSNFSLTKEILFYSPMEDVHARFLPLKIAEKKRYFGDFTSRYFQQRIPLARRK